MWRVSLVPQRDEFEYERGAAAIAEGEQGDGRKGSLPARDGIAPARKSLGFRSVLEF